jgi:hypothetical protein
MGGILKALRSHIPLLCPTSFWALIVLQLVALESLLVRSTAILHFHRLLQLLPIHHSPHSPLQQRPFLRPKAQKDTPHQILCWQRTSPQIVEVIPTTQLRNNALFRTYATTDTEHSLYTLSLALCFASTPVPIEALGQNA